MAEVTISKQIEFDAGHRVPKHEGKCSSPHGHRYRVVAHCAGSIIVDPDHPSEGMLVDFGVLKGFLNDVHDTFDHSFVVYEDDTELLKSFGRIPGHVTSEERRRWKVVVVSWIPTAENFAKAIFNRLEALISRDFTPGQLRLSHVEVWETPTSQAVYPVPH